MRVTAVTVFVVLASVAVAQQGQPQRQLIVRSLSMSGNTVLTASDRQYLRHQFNTPALSDLSELRQEIGERILFKYQDRGYFKTIVHDTDIHVVSILSHQEIVDVSVRVEESRRYRLSNINFKGATVFSNKLLRDCFLIKAGDVFERKRIGDGLERLRQKYGRVGYINVTSVPDTQIDESQGLISLLIDIDEGRQFHWGKLTILGDAADGRAEQKLLSAWKAHEGSIYDFNDALRSVLREVGARPNIRPDDIFKLSFDQQSGAVNVEITLAQPPPQY